MPREIKVVNKTVNFSNEIGKIKPMHAVNNGPKQGITLSWDISPYYREMNIPYSRLHDTEHPYGSNQFVDIHCIFSDFDADENDEKSYYFSSTDKCIKAIIDAGGKPFYRFGESIDHTDRPLYIHPPKDFEKWARICEHIIRHYNEGWANGFHYGIEYWEIWNEPEGAQMWTGTKEEYFELYRITSTHLKKCFGDSIKIGGYSSCSLEMLIREDDYWWPNHLMQYANDFIDFVKETNSPLDFFSYHRYTSDFRQYYYYNNAIRKWLDEKGYKDTELILNEWNPVSTYGVYGKKDERAAVIMAASLLACQKSDVDMMMLYDLRRATYYNPLITIDKIPLSSYWSFVNFGKLYKLGTEVDSGEFDVESTLYVCAAKNENEGGIFVVKPDDEDFNVKIKIENANYKKMRIYVMNQREWADKMTLIDERDFENEITLNFGARQRYSMAYIELI